MKGENVLTQHFSERLQLFTLSSTIRSTNDFLLVMPD